ncbi:uncharacterized protein [Panulirus ornatus]|uniref:uncharacterized protein n=1 Tax=Panulirus ornatus TaxID=150431 RepID=UPI003A88BC38
MAGSREETLLVQKMEDISEAWVERLLYNNFHTSDPRPSIRLKKWSKDVCPCTDSLAGFSSSRATLEVEYLLENEVGKETRQGSLKKEIYVVKMIPTHGYMTDLLTSERMHHTEVGQYRKFLHVLGAWEAEQRGMSKGLVHEIVPPHALAVSTERHFTLVLPELRNLGYETENISEGLGQEQLLTVSRKVGAFHGTVVAFKLLTHTDIHKVFHDCLNIAKVDSPVFSVFSKTGFDRLRSEWSRDASKTHLLQQLAPYEANVPAFVFSSLLPQEPFATVMHGDLQPSNIFFKQTTQGEQTIKMIDWATARYSQGPFDLVYLLNIGLNTEVRRQVTHLAKEAYFNAFNAALTDLHVNLSYPREVFEEQYTLGRQLVVIWSIMSINLFSSSQHLQQRLTDILTDVLLDPSVQPPTLPPPAAAAAAT